MEYELKRLAALKAFEILDTAAEPSFDRIVQLASDMFDTPIALISLVDEQRQWFKARVGLDACSTPRDIAFCTHAIDLGPGSVLVVEDARKDPRFASNPLVTGAPHIQFYAGATLTSASGHNLGTLCVIDTEARPCPGERELEQLKTLAQIAVDEIELAFANRQSRKKQHLLEMSEAVSGVGYWRFDLETQTPIWSDAVYAIHGVDRNSFDPKLDSAIDFYHPDDRAMVTANMERAIATKGGFDFQLRLVRADGAVRHVVSKANCELDDRGEVVALVGVFQDITDHIETVRAIETSEAKFRLLAEHSTDIIAKFDRQGRIGFISPACQQVLGYSEEEMTGRVLWEFIHPDDAAEVAAKYARFQIGNEDDAEVQVRYRAKHAKGHWVWLEGRPRTTRDAATGEIVSYQDAARDVSATVAAEAELTLARIEAEAAAQAKADFLANMSHELRTPLTAMLGFTNLVKEQPELQDATLAYVERAVNAGQALMATVNDILDFSALEAGQVEISPAPVQVAPYMERVVELFSQQAFEKGLELRATGLDRLPDYLSLDGHRVRQVLLNLIGNAVKFTDEGSVELAVDYDADDAMLTVSVTDTGVGIPRDAVGQLFQRFSQVDGSSTRKHGGTGLGLAICRGLVEAMGGKLGVESTPGVGSKFTCAIPSREAQTSPIENEASEHMVGLPPQCRILVTDDNESNRMLLSTLLGAMGAEVSTVPTGEAAVSAAQSNPFDLILMDRMMPGVGGEGAARQIRAISGPNADTPIVALTADPSGLAELGLFDGVAGKPLDLNELVGVMVRALNDGDDIANAA